MRIFGLTNVDPLNPVAAYESIANGVTCWRNDEEDNENKVLGNWNIRTINDKATTNVQRKIKNMNKNIQLQSHI